MYEEYDNDDEDIDGPQHFQVNIVIHEGRHMAVRNATAKLRISIGNRTKTLRAKTKKTDAPYFNELCIFQFYLPLNALLDKIITVAVYGLKKVGIGKLIGSFSVEMATIWVQPNHQFYHKWAALMHPKNPSAGVKGYVKCDIGILARGSKSKQIGGDLGENIENNLLVPFGEVNDRQRARFVFSVFRADNFSDSSNSVSFRPLYTYVKITYAGITGRTSIAKNTRTPTWNEELSFVDMIPALCRFVHIEIWDAFQRTKGPMGSTSLDLRKLSHESETGFLPTYGPSFLNLYQIFGNMKNQNKCGFINNSYTYICRLLIALRTEVIDYAEDVFVKQKGMLVKPKSIPALQEDRYFRYREFILFAALFDVLLFDANVIESKIGIHINIGPKKYEDLLRGKKKKDKKKGDGVSEASEKKVKFQDETGKKEEEPAKEEATRETPPREEPKKERWRPLTHWRRKSRSRSPREWKPLKRLGYWKGDTSSSGRSSSPGNRKGLKALDRWPEAWRPARKRSRSTTSSGSSGSWVGKPRRKVLATWPADRRGGRRRSTSTTSVESSGKTSGRDRRSDRKVLETWPTEWKGKRSRSKASSGKGSGGWGRRPKRKVLETWPTGWRGKQGSASSASSDSSGESWDGRRKRKVLETWPTEWKGRRSRSKGSGGKSSRSWGRRSKRKVLETWPTGWRGKQGSASSASSDSGGESWDRRPKRKVLETWPTHWRGRHRSVSSSSSDSSGVSWDRRPKRKVLETWPTGWKGRGRSRSSMSRESVRSRMQSLNSWTRSSGSWPQGPKRRVLGNWPKEWKRRRKRETSTEGSAGELKPRKNTHFWPWVHSGATRKKDAEATDASSSLGDKEEVELPEATPRSDEESLLSSQDSRSSTGSDGSSSKDFESGSQGSGSKDSKSGSEESSSGESETRSEDGSTRSSTSPEETTTSSSESSPTGSTEVSETDKSRSEGEVEETETESDDSSSSDDEGKKKKKKRRTSLGESDSMTETESEEQTETEESDSEEDEEKEKKKKKKKRWFKKWKRKKGRSSADSDAEDEEEDGEEDREKPEKKAWYARWRKNKDKNKPKSHVFSPRNSTQKNIDVYYALYPMHFDNFSMKGGGDAGGRNKRKKKRKRKRGKKKKKKDKRRGRKKEDKYGKGKDKYGKRGAGDGKRGLQKGKEKETGKKVDKKRKEPEKVLKGQTGKKSKEPDKVVTAKTGKKRKEPQKVAESEAGKKKEFGWFRGKRKKESEEERKESEEGSKRKSRWWREKQKKVTEEPKSEEKEKDKARGKKSAEVKGKKEETAEEVKRKKKEPAEEVKRKKKEGAEEVKRKKKGAAEEVKDQKDEAAAAAEVKSKKKKAAGEVKSQTEETEGDVADDKDKKRKRRWKLFGGKERKEEEPAEEAAEEAVKEEAEGGGEEETNAEEFDEEEEDEGVKKKKKKKFWSRQQKTQSPQIVVPEKVAEELKEPQHVKTYNGCNAITGQKVKVRDQYGFMTITGKYPCLHIAGEWPNALRRAYRSNIVKKFVGELQSELKEVEEELQSGNPVEASEKMRKFLANMSKGCREMLSLIPKIVPEDTNLSRERKRYYHREIRDMSITTGLASQKRVIVAEEELKKVYNHLSTLKRYSINPDDSFPDTEIWLTRDGKGVAQHRLRTQKIAYSANEKERGHRSGIIESVIIRDNNGGVVAKLELFMWFGLGDEFTECRKLLPSGYRHEDHACPGTAVSGIPLFLSYSEVHYFQFRVFLFQASLTTSTDQNGLSDPFVRVTLLGEFKETRVMKETLNPTWNEMIVFPRLAWHGPAHYIKSNSVKATVEVFDKDVLAKSELIGRTLLKPVVKLQAESYTLPDFPPRLTWQEIWKDCNEQGRILLAAELLELSKGELPEESKKGKITPIPNDIRPTFVGHRLEIFFWGVRGLRKRKAGRVKVFVTVECAGKFLSSQLAKYDTGGVNFRGGVQVLDLNLPDESEYKPPVSIKLFQTNPLSFNRETYAGNCIVPSVKVFLCGTFDDDEMKNKEAKYKEYFFEKKRLRDAEERARAAEREALRRKSLRKTTIKDILESIAFFFVKIYKGIKCRLTRSCAGSKPATHADPMEDTLDWWVKYHAAKEGLTNFDSVVIYDEELEAQPEFNGFSDNIHVFKITTGKKKSGTEATVATVKAAIKLYRWPLPNNVKTLYGVDVRNGLLADLPSNAAIKFVARVYIVSGRNLTPKDVNGRSDPYLYLRLGSQKIADGRNYVAKQVNPVFGKCFEFRGSFPKENLLQIRVMDHDASSRNDLIGETFVDLESRYYTKHHASCGVARRYATSGYAAWRDVTKPTELLKTVCKQSNMGPPVFTRSGVKIGEYEFASEARSDGYREENDALEALRRWHEIPLRGFRLVPEHIESRPLYNPKYPGIEQGKLEMWIDIFPADFRYIPPIVDITPRQPVAMELRAIVWNVEDVILDDKTLFLNEKMSDIYVRGWLSANESDRQQTDVHYRSMNGEGNFNWRFVFPFNYVLSERRLVIYKKEAFETKPEQMKFPCRLELQVWDNDFFSDDFLGSLILELSSMPRGAKISTRCKLSMFEESTPKIDLFQVRRTRGWWPFRRIVDPEASEYALTGKIDLELEVLTEVEAKESPAGRGREEPDALPPPRRPESSFLWFLNPWKTFRYIVIRKFGKHIVFIAIASMIVAFIVIGIYAVPGYTIKKMMKT